MFKRIKKEEFKHIYERMSKTFHSFKVLPYEDYLNLLQDNKYECLAYYVNGIEVGYVMGYLYNDLGFYYMDFLEIYEEYRNNFYGHQLLTSLLKEPFAKKGILFEYLVKYNDDEKHFGLYDYDYLADRPRNKLDRFFYYFSQLPIAEYDVDLLFEELNPDEDAMALKLILNPGYEISQTELLKLLLEAKEYIYNNSPLKDKMIEACKYSVANREDMLTSEKFELVKLEEKDLEDNDISYFISTTNNRLFELLFNKEENKALVSKLVNKDSYLNLNNLYKYTFNNRVEGILLLLDNKECDLFKLLKNENIAKEKIYEAETYINSLKGSLKDDERLIFIGWNEEYYSLISRDYLVPLLPRGYTYYVDVNKMSSYEQMNYQELGFKVLKERENWIRLVKKY